MNPRSAPRPGPRRGAVWPVALLAAAAIAAYANTFAVPFIMDDASAVINNPSIRNLAQLGTVLSPASSLSTGRRPLLNLTFALNYAVGGRRVAGYHAFNLAVHVLAALALYGLLARTLALPRIAAGSRAPPGVVAACIAGLWALHPLQTESVTYISQRAEALMALWFLVMLYGLVRSAGSPRPAPWLAVSAAACFLGMATKEVMVTAPLVALLFDRVFLAGSFRAAWSRRTVYYVGLALSWAWLAYLMAGTGFHSSGVGFASSLGTWYYVCTEAKVVVHYVGLAFWPHPLVFDYGPEYVVRGLVPSLPFALPVLAGLGAAVLLWRRHPALAFLACTFFILLAPTSSFVPVLGQPMAESRMYLPLAAVISLVVLACFRVLGPRALVAVVPIGALLLLATVGRNRAYATDIGIWEDSLARIPVNSRGQNNLAVAISREPGRTREAVEHFEEAIRIEPLYAEAHCNLGTVLADLPGRRPDAIAHYREALRITPDYAAAHINLGSALVDDGRIPEAIEHLEAALRIDPGVAVVHVNLGNAYARVPGMDGKAIAQYEEAQRLDPDYGAAYYDLANVYAKEAGRMPDAIGLYERALALDPALAEAHVNLANALTGVGGRIPDAIAHYRAALRLKPDLADGELDLANVLSITPEGVAGSIEHYERALSLAAGNAAAHYRFGNALAALHRWGEAEGEYREAVRLSPDFVDAHNNLANVLVVTDRIDEAKAEFGTVLKLDPSRESARKTLAMISAMGDKS